MPESTPSTLSTQTLFERVRSCLATRCLADEETAALLMVSGGSDSTALAYLAKRLFEQGMLGALALLHVNHQLRGDDADRDAAFTEGLAHYLGIPFFLCQVDVAGKVKASGDNIEAVARQERYIAAQEALSSLCRHEGVPLQDGRILTAHTSDDRVENFYMRSIVGTGPGGFRSMKYRNGHIIRPLLDLSREDLRAFILTLDAQGKAFHGAEGERWREDATNAHTDRFRAYVRHELIPAAKARNPRLNETLCRSMNLIADEDDLLQEFAKGIELRTLIWNELNDRRQPHFEAGFTLLPPFGREQLPLQRRVVFSALQQVLGPEKRVEYTAVDAVLSAFEDHLPKSGYVTNIQGNLAVSSNKTGVLIEPMAAFRARRKRGQDHA